jgi:hypothetical protein
MDEPRVGFGGGAAITGGVMFVVIQAAAVLIYSVRMLPQDYSGVPGGGPWRAPGKWPGVGPGCP